MVWLLDCNLHLFQVGRRRVPVLPLPFLSSLPPYLPLPVFCERGTDNRASHEPAVENSIKGSRSPITCDATGQMVGGCVQI